MLVIGKEPMNVLLVVYTLTISLFHHGDVASFMWCVHVNDVLIHVLFFFSLQET